MAPLNNKYGIIIYAGIFLVIFSVVGWFLLFQKQKEFYIINKVDVKAVMLMSDSITGYSIMPLKSEMGASNWGISVKLSKEYIPGENSPRILFGGTMEPGIGGMKSKINRFDVVVKEGNKTIVLNDSLFAGEYGSKDSINLGDAIYHLYDNTITLSQFIADVNNNVKYTKGMSFDNWEIYFWFNKRTSDIDAILKYFPKNLFVDVETDDLSIEKPLIQN